MRTSFSYAIASVGLSALIAGMVAAAAPAAKPTVAWEYKFVITEFRPSQPGDGQGPNALGADGWELITATADSKNQYVLYYKRPK